MRVTNQSLIFTSQNRLQANMQRIERLREDVSSGIRLRKMSDDPSSGSEVVRVSSSMRALSQFRRNINIGNAQASAEEGVLNDVTNVLTRAIELGVGQSGSTSNAQSRTIVKAEVDQLLSHAVDTGNTKFGDDYLFGGTRSGELPFQLPTTPTGPFSRLLDSGGFSVNPSGNRQIEIGDNKFLTPTHNGTEVFLTSDVLESLRALSTALGANNVAGITAATDRIGVANSNLQTLLGTQGARINEMDAQTATLNAVELSLKAYRSDLRDTEVDKALVELTGKQTMYQAAMSATSRILSLSLANYL